ncbi:MAG: glycine--tRNA ligase subunit beta, partial [Rhodospirillaceae bacterium]|nr:glycine--tRNA ligase subunit beta [Rhodospirillaceae bacterium]
MPELLLEILSEEIPARMQAKAADDLKRLVCDGLKKAGLEFSNAEAYVTPRRLALVVDGIPEKQPDISEERRGPSVDAPDKAIQGFLGSVGMTMDEVETRQTEKGMFLFAKIEKQGRLATDVLMEVLPAALSALPWPKSMRWPRFDQRWVRPIHSMIGLFAGGEVPFPWGAAVAGNVTSGHRFLAPDAIT